MIGYVINLDRRIERFAIVRDKLKLMGIDAIRFRAFDAGPTAGKHRSEIACRRSHIKALRQAWFHLEGVFIFEDDVLVHKDFVAPSLDCDMLLLGASQWKWINKQSPTYRARGRTTGAFAYWVSQETLRHIVKYATGVIDQYYRDHVQPYFNVQVCHPNLVIADVSSSDIHGPRDAVQHAKRMDWNLDDYV